MSQHAMIASATVIAAGLLLMVSIVSVGGLDRYYVGLILVIIAVHVMFGLFFTFAIVLSIEIFLSYVMIEMYRAHLPALALNNAMFLGSAWLISAYGGYTVERVSRLAFFRARVIEQKNVAISYEALHDFLTCLRNLRMFTKALKRSLAFHEREVRPSAVHRSG